jgi:hypothetical protein
VQEALAVQSLADISDHWRAFAHVSRWFAVMVLIFTAVVSVVFLAVLLFLVTHDIWFAKSMLHQKKRQTDGMREYKSGVV